MTEANNCCGTTCDKAAIAAEIAKLKRESESKRSQKWEDTVKKSINANWPEEL